MMTFQKKIENTVIAMQQLMDVLNQEVELLKSGKPDGHDDMVKLKQHLIKQYETTFKLLLAEKDKMRTLPQNIKDILEQSQIELNKAVKENALRVKAHLGATEYIIQVIREKILEHQNSDSVYKNPNTHSKRSVTSNYSAVPLAYSAEY